MIDHFGGGNFKIKTSDAPIIKRADDSKLSDIICWYRNNFGFKSIDIRDNCINAFDNLRICKIERGRVDYMTESDDNSDICKIGCDPQKNKTGIRGIFKLKKSDRKNIKTAAVDGLKTIKKNIRTQTARTAKPMKNCDRRAFTNLRQCTRRRNSNHNVDSTSCI